MALERLQAYTKELKDHQHPAAELGEFLLKHSNSPGYLIANLETFLDVVKEDMVKQRQLGRLFGKRQEFLDKYAQGE